MTPAVVSSPLDVLACLVRADGNVQQQAWLSWDGIGTIGVGSAQAPTVVPPRREGRGSLAAKVV